MRSLGQKFSLHRVFRVLSDTLVGNCATVPHVSVSDMVIYGTLHDCFYVF